MQGLHLTADLHECQCAASLLLEPARLRETLLGAVQGSGLTGVAELFHDFSAQGGAGSGITGVVLLAESHVAIHTWPEKNAVTLDVYVCNFGADNTERAHRLFDTLTTAFAPKHCVTHELKRGAP